MFVHDQTQSTKLFLRIPKPSCFEDRDHHDKFLLHECFSELYEVWQRDGLKMLKDLFYADLVYIP